MQKPSIYYYIVQIITSDKLSDVTTRVRAIGTHVLLPKAVRSCINPTIRSKRLHEAPLTTRQL